MIRRKQKTTKIEEIIKSTKDSLVSQIKEAEKKEDKAKKKPDYMKLVERIVNSIENKKEIDTLAYDALTQKYPQTKNIINNLISELRIFSIYDDEPNTVNFDYSAYLEQIKALVEIE